MQKNRNMLLNGSPAVGGTAQKFWNIASVSETEGEITLYGDVLSKKPYDYWTGEAIPGDYITPEGFREDLEAVAGKEKITVKINSCGGDLYTGIAIHNAIKGLSADVSVIVEGIAASAASVIAMAGKNVSVFPGSIIMIHGVKVWNWDGMTLQDVKKFEQMMDANEKAIAEIYHAKTGIEVDKLRNMMTKEKWMTGKEAVELGFADSVIEDAEETEITMSANKKFLMVNGIRHDSAFFRNMPDFPVAKESAKPDPKPDAVIKSHEGSRKIMTLDELRAEQPELVEQIENSARSSVDVAAAVTAERKRIEEIDSIAASVPDQQMVNEAKYGENACTAQELSFRVLKQSAKEGQNFLADMQKDAAASGTASVGASPNGGAEKTEAEKDAAEFKNIVDLFNSQKGEIK